LEHLDRRRQSRFQFVETIHRRARVDRPEELGAVGVDERLQLAVVAHEQPGELPKILVIRETGAETTSATPSTV
jgi:hypothetical protein